MLPEFSSIQGVPVKRGGIWLKRSAGPHLQTAPRRAATRGSPGRNGGACRPSHTGLVRRGPKMRDERQGGADDCDTVHGRRMCSWRAFKLLAKKMLRQPRTPSHRIWRDMPASNDLSDESNTEITIDTGRRWAENLTRLKALPAVESTRIGGVTEPETVRGGPSRVMALR